MSSSMGWGRWRHACTLVAMGLVLTACGGGSDSPKSANDNRQPSGVGGNASSAYLVTESSPAGATGLNAHQLHLVNPATGEVFKSIPVGPGGGYELGGAFTPSANGQGGTRENASVLFFIRRYDNGEGHLFQAPLVGTQAGVETRISNVIDACGIWETKIARLDAIASWLRVETAGDDHDCRQGLDNQFVFVRSDFGSAVAPAGSPFGREKVLVWEYNAQGELTWIYGYVPWLGAVYAVDTSTAKLRPVTNGFTLQTVDIFSAHPTDAHKALVRVGRTITTLSWLNGEASLGPAVATLTDAPLGFVGTDARHVYFSQDSKVYRIDPQGVVSLLTDLPQGGDGLDVIAQTPSSLLIVQGAQNLDSTLWVVSKNGDSKPRLIETLVDGSNYFLAGIAGEVVVYGSSTERDSSQGFVTLKRFVANSAVQPPTTLVTGARYFYGINERQINHGESTTSHLFWCEVGGQPNNCRADRLRSYRLSTDTVVNLGPLSPPADPSTWDLLGDVDYVDRSYRAMLEEFGSSASPGSARARWLFQADTPQSLKAIVLP
ncbi:hypothetical protein [Aquabacterium sp.]|uniref:hypothetical protein n=1 Tax=Aquabacterium sp. TaxID=1872578 RepID=UPI0024879B1D|nr:hypothetical protein [Aquabacterium sp.]MDI1259917.1 hypothetical protein [Aquabacterium sp.]